MAMARKRSIRFDLTAVSLLFLSVVVGLGLFSVGSLRYINGISAEIRDRWLQSTQLLGDLNNYTSDFRTEEGAYLLAGTPSELAASERQMQALTQIIDTARRGYRLVYHDDAELALYQRFETPWLKYRKVVDEVIALSHARRRDEAIGLYKTASRTFYDTAQDALGVLTAHTVASAAEASNHAAKAYHKAWLLIAAAMLSAGLLVAAAVSYIRRRLSEPLLALADRMRRVAANERDVEIAGIERGDEIGEMARAVVTFQRNAVELALSRHALAEQASLLEEKLEAEQRLTMLQRNFVAMASHEFRTPLTIIDAHAQRLVARKDRLAAEEIAERAGKVRGAVKRITSVIGNLLDTSRLVDGASGPVIEHVAFDLTELIHEVCELHREVTPHAAVVESFTAQPVPLDGDPKLLFQAFSNLLSNAIKYSPDGSPITIGIAAEGEAVTVMVHDRGVGVPEEERERLFERYFRGSNVSGTVGTGIGLYFVRMVVELHGGTVSVESAEDEGSTFAVRLPRVPLSLAQQTLASASG
jgi:two-component system, OmpR family, sensor kinase